MDISEEIAEIQHRFSSAARSGEGLILSSREVWLLASLEQELPPPLGEHATPLTIAPEGKERFLQAIALIEPLNPFPMKRDGQLEPTVWSMFKQMLEVWSNSASRWEFTKTQLTIEHKTGTITIPLKTYGN